MEELLSLAQQTSEEAEVFEVAVEQTPVVFEANRLKQLHTHQAQSIALRLVRDGRVGFATTTRLNNKASLVEKVLQF